MSLDNASSTNDGPLTCETSSIDVCEESVGFEEDPLLLKPTSSASPYSSFERNRVGRPKKSLQNFSLPAQSTVIANFLLEKHGSKADNEANMLRQLDSTLSTMKQLQSPWGSEDSSSVITAKHFQNDYIVETTKFSISDNINDALENRQPKSDVGKVEYVNVNFSKSANNPLETENSKEDKKKLYDLRPSSIQIHPDQKNLQEKNVSYICDQCGFQAKGPRNLRSHCRSHAVELPYTCHMEGCKFVGKNSNSLKYHKRTMHPTGDPLQCGYVGCDFVTLFPPTLRMHNLKKHSGEKPIACELCPYRCFMNVELRKHLRTHSSLTPYACDFPGCNYACKIASNLRKHKRSHTDERPYACDQCTFRSNFISSLKAHKRTHTGEKPYCCHQCGYRCNSASNLKKHISQKHKLKCGPVCKNGDQLYVATSIPDLPFPSMDWPQSHDDFKMERIEDG